MKIFELPHNSTEWFAARLGRATTSRFGEIITPKKRELSASHLPYALCLIHEMKTGEPTEKFEQSYWMERGSLLEAEAGKLYEFETDTNLMRGGFITNDAETLGASPDRRVGNDGFVEIKCPAPWNHLEHLRSKVINPNHMPQVQGQLLIGEREWVDWFSYHPEYQPSRIRTYRDEAFIADLKLRLDEFQEKLYSLMSDYMRDGVLEKILTPTPITVPVDGLAAYLGPIKKTERELGGLESEIGVVKAVGDNSFPGDRP